MSTTRSRTLSYIGNTLNRTITSHQNPEIKEVAKLADAKERKKQQRFIAEGLRTVATFVENNKTPIQLYATLNAQHHAESLNVEYTLVPDVVMAKMSQAATPSGILGVFPIPKQPDPAQLGEGIVLAQLADPGNIGTLIRTCAALGRYSVVAIETADLWSPKVIQASAGTIAQMQIFNWSWEELLRHKRTMNLVGLVVSNGEALKQRLPNSLLVIGSEAHGIPNHWVEQCDKAVTLPMPGEVESLNAAVAGSIAMYLAWNN